MKLFSELPNAVRILWAKDSPTGGYSILCHMLDVAAVAEVILSRETETTKIWASRCFGLPLESFERWISTLVGLHDFGKAIPGFQTKWERGRKNDENEGLTFHPSCLGVKNHDYASANLLRSLLQSRVENSGCASVIAQALGAHHGYFPRSDEIKESRPINEDQKWKETRDTLFQTYWDTLSPIGNPTDPIMDLPTIAWFAGLTSIADWIGSNQEWFPLEEGDESIIGHYNRAKKNAEKALNKLGWPNFCPLLTDEIPVEERLGRILGQNTKIHPRPLQLVADQMLCKAEGPTLLIVEAPMGEGKTELAFLAHLRLQENNRHRGLYIALPTQATGNAVFDRTLTFLNNFAENVKLDIQLVHGGSLLDERIHKLRDVNRSLNDSVSSAAWFSQRKRGLISPYGVGTIDQALFATLNVKHHFVRLWGLANRVVILDEVHAYDTYTSGLIESLLKWLKAMNCSVVLMSATLPKKSRDAFLKAWGAQNSEMQTISYPRITMASSLQLETAHIPCRSMEPITVAGIDEDIQTIAEKAIEKFEQGGCGAIIANTVQRAQELYLLIKSKIGDRLEILLFHSRFPADERSIIEKKVLEKFGKTSDLHNRSTLLISTQVVEQSLDIDFDFLISDLAPIDLLLQRAGRLHRHERVRPKNHDKPCLMVAGLVPNRLPEIIQTKWKWIYEPHLLYRTWALGSIESIWKLPEDIDRLVQSVYGSTPLPNLSEEIVKKIEEDAYGEYLGKNNEEKNLANKASIHSTAQPKEAYLNKPRGNEEGDGLGIKPVTRLGDESVAVVPIFVSVDGWRLMPNQNTFDPNSVISDELAKRIYLRQVKLSRKDIINELKNNILPNCFEGHPLLKHLKILILTGNSAQIGNTLVCIDAELGITYETITKNK